MIRRALLLLSIAALVSACSIKQFEVNVLGDVKVTKHAGLWGQHIHAADEPG